MIGGNQPIYTWLLNNLSPFVLFFQKVEKISLQGSICRNMDRWGWRYVNTRIDGVLSTQGAMDCIMIAQPSKVLSSTITWPWSKKYAQMMDIQKYNKKTKLINDAPPSYFLDNCIFVSFIINKSLIVRILFHY